MRKGGSREREGERKEGREGVERGREGRREGGREGVNCNHSIHSTEVVHSRHKVKRLSSLINSKSPSDVTQLATPTFNSTNSDHSTRRRLHPAIQSMVRKFSKSSLHHVDPVVKLSLPSRKGKTV